MLKSFNFLFYTLLYNNSFSFYDFPGVFDEANETDEPIDIYWVPIYSNF